MLKSYFKITALLLAVSPITLLANSLCSYYRVNFYNYTDKDIQGIATNDSNRVITPDMNCHSTPVNTPFYAPSASYANLAVSYWYRVGKGKWKQVCSTGDGYSWTSLAFDYENSQGHQSCKISFHAYPGHNKVDEDRGGCGKVWPIQFQPVVEGCAGLKISFAGYDNPNTSLSITVINTSSLAKENK